METTAFWEGFTLEGFGAGLHSIRRAATETGGVDSNDISERLREMDLVEDDEKSQCESAETIRPPLHSLNAYHSLISELFSEFLNRLV